MRFDDGVVEVDCLLGVIANGGDVPSRIVGVRKVLQSLGPRMFADALDERSVVVVVGRPRPVAVVDQRHAALWRRNQCL